MVIQLLASLFKVPLDTIYYVKWLISYIAIYFHKLCYSRRFDLYDLRVIGDPVKLDYVIPQLEKDLESPFPETHLQCATDEVLFYGVNSKSECVLFRIARDLSHEAEAWIYLKLANGKTYQLAENIGYQESFEGKCSIFSCGNLQMHYLSPMRTWRIFFCGMLRETSQGKNETEESVFIKFVFLWKAASDVYDLPVDINSNGLASALANSKWKLPFVPSISKFVNAMNFYSQFGVVTGTVTIDEGPEYEMYLIGEKIRNLGKSSYMAGGKFTDIMGNVPQTGQAFHLGRVTVPNLFHNLPYGYIIQTGGNMEEVKEVEININSPSLKNVNSIKANFTSSEKCELKGSVLCEPVAFYSNQGWKGFLEICMIEFTVQEQKGYGLIMSGEIYKEEGRSSKSIPVVQYPSTVPLVIKISDEIANLVNVSGGKGSSLGKLTQLSNKNESFTVPNGIIVTTAAFREFLTPEINIAVKNLESVVYGNVEGDVKETCSQISSIVENTLLPNKISDSIAKGLRDIFGNEIHSKKFAVRSSATGEDTSTMSAAGQMDTFLGVQGLQKIFRAVKKCWASQFSHRAVEYKRYNGQILNSPMAVVVQEMVACDVSGVLFTCNPVNNNPSFITITANYGLGESVVSGSVEPDTIVLRRKENESLNVESVIIGTKQQRIIMQETGNVVTEDSSENLTKESCLSEEMAICLGKIGIAIESFYKSTRDIEWGILKDKIYIFQSRPVTNAARETDFEIKHEFDAPMLCEREWVSIANVGEVMPGAATPLGIQIISKYFGIFFRKQAINLEHPDSFKKGQYVCRNLIAFYNHMMMSVTDVLNNYGTDTPAAKGIMVSVFGRILDDPDLLNYAREKVTRLNVPPNSFKTIIRSYWDLFFHTYNTSKVLQKFRNYQSNFLKPKTSEAVFEALMNSCSDFDEGVAQHMISSGSASRWNMHLFTILCNVKGGFDTDVYNDFSKLLATYSNVESVDVPQAMQKVALQIAQDINSEEFKSMSIEEAEHWLKTSASDAGYKFRQFLKRHGHRCIKESDVYSITWAMNPKPLVKLLQNLVGACKADGKSKNVDYEKLFSELNTPLNFWTKFLLKLVIPQCRKGAFGREAGKTCSIKGIDYWRQGFRYLAKLMVSEGRIPDPDLIFFFTTYEIDELLKSRSPRIISRAIYRRKLFPVLDEYKFPEIMKGIPKPINDADESSQTCDFVADLNMKGIPVSQGIAKGFARVAISIKEASNLKPGEILITHCTDIGWSPYFPIISGVVTELGGLISHGAVVSREYGLPCVVGLQGATKKFQTGDYVLLDGNKGTLQRLPQPEQ